MTIQQLRMASLIGIVVAMTLILVATLRPVGAGTDPCPLGVPCALGHLIGFAILGVPLAAWYATSGVARRWPRGSLIALLIAIAVFAAADELRQDAIQGRSADPWDWVADMIGAVIGLVGGSYVLRNLMDRVRR